MNRYNILDIRGRYTPQERGEIARSILVRFLTSAGIVYNIAECALYDAIDYINKEKDLPKGLWKGWVKQAYLLSKGSSVDKFAKEHFLRGYSLWLDMTDYAQEELANIIKTTKLTLSNIVLKHTDKYAELKTQLLHTLHLYEYCTSYYKQFFLVVKQKHWLDLEQPYRQMKQNDVYLKLRAAATEVCEDILEYVTETVEMQQCDNILSNMLAKEDFYNKIAYKALAVNEEYNHRLKELENEN